MAGTRPDNLHSRLVYWLKILLPLTALTILSTLFLLSRNVRPEDAIPYAEVDIADRIRTPRLTAPDFAGMTADGAALSLKAAEARLGADGSTSPGAISELVGLLETPDGARTDLVAKAARLDQDAKTMRLEGGVVISNSTGYRIETAGISVALDRTSLDSLGSVTATGPAGTFKAGSLHLGLAIPEALASPEALATPEGLATAAPPTYVLVFKDGVRMIYLPKPQGTGN